MLWSSDPMEQVKFWGKNMQIFLNVLKERVEQAKTSNDVDEVDKWESRCTGKALGIPLSPRK